MINGSPLIIGGGSPEILNLIASNVKKGVNVKVGTENTPGKYADIIGTFEGYVPEVGDIYKNGVWGDGWSAANVRQCGYRTSDYSSFPPSWSYGTLDITVTRGYSSDKWGFTELTKPIVFSPDGNTFTVEVYNAGTSSSGVILFMSPQLGGNGSNDFYFTGTTGNVLNINGVNTENDGYTVRNNDWVAVASGETKTISITNTQEFQGYLGILTRTDNIHIKKMSIS